MEQWLIKLADDELKLVTSDELLQMEKTADEFDGFYGWQVLGKLNKHDVSNRREQLIAFFDYLNKQGNITNMYTDKYMYIDKYLESN